MVLVFIPPVSIYHIMTTSRLPQAQISAIFPRDYINTQYSLFKKVLQLQLWSVIAQKLARKSVSLS